MVLKNQVMTLLFIIIIIIFKINFISNLYCTHYVNDELMYVNSTTVLVSKNMDIFLEQIKLECDKQTKYNSIYFNYFIEMYIGFEISNLNIILIENYNKKLISLKFYFEFFYFQFYEETFDKDQNRNLKLLNESSSFDLLLNYHKLYSLKNKNILNLYEKFTSLFVNYEMTIVFDGNTFIRNKLSRLVFKESRIQKISFYKFTNTSLRKHFVEFNQQDDLFRFFDYDDYNYTDDYNYFE